ncbi:MAG: transglutaminase domain-containing protein [Bacteroidales bacterium]|nr:transglutaminase domain-containing protein [Candidatus Cacconaster merdequi]
MKTRILTTLSLLLLLAGCGQENQRVPGYSWEEDLAYRESVDYTWTPEQVKEYIQKYIPDVTDEQIDNWTKNGPLEAKEINGKLMYYRRTAGGLFLVDPECRQIKWNYDHPDGIEVMSRHDSLEYNNMKAIIDDVNETGNPLAQPSHMKVKFTLTVNADAVPEGETIRCWLPFPRKDVARQQDVALIGTSQSEYQFSDPECPHSTLYMEAKAVAGEPTVFSEEFEYTIYGEWHKIDPEKIQPYDKTTDLYKKYTAEREKHIVFSDRLRNLADSLTAGIENPYLQAKAIFEWVEAMFPWSGAREYSTLANIPEYVLDSGHGDCGQVTLLFCTLCRIKGIPAHFQSGHVMDLDGSGMHDWSEIYFEGIGWVPVDMSFGIRTYSWNDDAKYFFLSGNDTHRLIINSDYGYELSPKKIYPRSDDVDFQRGEVEWKGGNLYYPEWKYKMEVEHL